MSHSSKESLPHYGRVTRKSHSLTSINIFLFRRRSPPYRSLHLPYKALESTVFRVDFFNRTDPRGGLILRAYSSILIDTFRRAYMGKDDNKTPHRATNEDNLIRSLVPTRLKELLRYSVIASCLVKLFGINFHLLPISHRL